MTKTITNSRKKKEKQEFYKISLSLHNEDRYVIQKYLKFIGGNGTEI